MATASAIPLRGVAATAAGTNRVVGWAIAVVLVVAAFTAAGWVLLAHHRTLRDAPTVAAFTAATDRSFAPHHHRQLDRTTDAGGRELHQVTAVRLDRLEPGQVNP